MKFHKILTSALCAVLSTVCLTSAAADITIIPQPVEQRQASGSFRLRPTTTIGYADGLRDHAMYLDSVLSASTGWDFKVTDDIKKADIRLSMKPLFIRPDEAYTLDVTPREVNITGHDRGGVFYGIQSLLQLLPPQVYSDRRQRGTDWTIPAVHIYDAPAQPWRAMMLDVARYFHDKDMVKKYIDMMAMYKMNKLQFHLIDDSGWRLESKKYPRLTEVGAWAGPDGHKLGGYYTQDDIRELVEYGRLRNVEIIPEIEFPAHILSAIVAYPWLSCTGKQHELPLQHFISRDLLCVGKESSIRFLQDILDETVELFPSEYINIGGDEAVYTRYKTCPDCQALMRREGLTDESQLQGYLTNVVARMMKEKGRTVIGWEEIIDRGRIDEQVVAMIWHNVDDTIKAATQGHKAILTPATHLYLDFPESATPGEVKAATWMPPISVEKCYTMPLNDHASTSTVIGVQGSVWSDQFIHGTVLQEIPLIDENRSERYIEYLTFPRLMAVAELGWTPKTRRDYADFARRLKSHYARLDHKDVTYRVPEPEIASMAENADGSVTFTLTPSVDGSRICYTTDGTYPNVHSPLYTGPVTVNDKSDFHAMTVVTPRHYSLPIHFAPDYSAYESRYGAVAAQWKPLTVQPEVSVWRFECTGKISGNGNYEITFVPLKGDNSLNTGEIKVYKRDELLAVAGGEFAVSAGSDPAVYRFAVDSFEAGTPFFIDVQSCAPDGNDTYGLVLIRKVDY